MLKVMWNDLKRMILSEQVIATFSIVLVLLPLCLAGCFNNLLWFLMYPAYGLLLWALDAKERYENRQNDSEF